MSDDFVLKSGDNLPELDAVLLDSHGEPVDLTGATATFTWRPITGTSLDNQTVNATVVSAADGTVKVSWTAQDLEQPGVFWGEFKVTFSGGEILSFPNDRHLRFRVVQDLGLEPVPGP